MEDRVIELEIKISHQEHLLETLNQVIIEQGKELDGLKRRVELLTDRVKAAAQPEQEPDEPPPHY